MRRNSGRKYSYSYRPPDDFAAPTKRKTEIVTFENNITKRLSQIDESTEELQSVKTKVRENNQESVALESRLSYIKTSDDDSNRISRIISRRFVVPRMEIL